MNAARTVYMAVQVVSRNPDKSLRQWFDGEPRATRREAERERDDNAAEYPGTEYQVVEQRTVELGPPKKLRAPRGTR